MRNLIVIGNDPYNEAKSVQVLVEFIPGAVESEAFSNVIGIPETEAGKGIAGL